MKPRRSVLYMPGANARALEKARTLACDGLIFDLEDAVAPAGKTLAREQIAAALGDGGYGYRELVVRVNGLDTPWGTDDIVAAARLDVAAILVPKVDSAAQVLQFLARLDAAGGAHLPVWLMIETPGGVLDVRPIAAASPRVETLVMGTSDLVAELRAEHTPSRDNLAFALQGCVLGARAAGIDVLDGVHLDFRNLESFRLACEAARSMGFDGKTLIHPAQIDIANDVFGVDPAAVEQARKVLQAWEQARARGEGVAELDGRLIENLHAAEAERLLAMAAALDGRCR